MKLAVALIERADLQKRIEQLKQGIVRNAKVQEGYAPAEDPNALLDEIDQLSADLVRLIQRINRTNTAIRLGDGRTIADAIAARDRLKMLHALLRQPVCSLGE